MRYGVFMKLLTKNDWQRSRTVALFQSRGITLPTNGMRWILWVILPTGTTLAIWASPRRTRETLYRRLFASGLGWKGVNHSTYTKCSGGWLLVVLHDGLVIDRGSTAPQVCIVRHDQRHHAPWLCPWYTRLFNKCTIWWLYDVISLGGINDHDNERR